MRKFKKLILILSPYERKRAWYLLFMIILMALIDMLGVASIMPFIALLTNPEIIETNTLLKFVYLKGTLFGVKNEKQFLILVGFSVFLILITSILFKVLTTYFQSRFIEMTKHNMSVRLVEKYLNQPYSWFLNRNSSYLGKSILSEVGNVIGRGLTPMISLISNSLLTLLLFILLVLVEPKLTLIVIVIVGVFYGLVYKFNQDIIKRIGKENFLANEIKFKVLLEAFGATKEIKLAGLENVFLNQFSNPSKTIAKNSTLIDIISQIPRYTLEAISFGGMILIIIYFMISRGDITNVLPIVALYAFAGYRLMPAVQKIFVNITNLRVIGPALNSLYEDLKNLKKSEKIENKSFLKLKQEIKLKNVSYNYPNSSRTVLRNININIPVHKTIGIVGKTGSGKTTTVDIILGLIEAQEGSLEVDGKIINYKNKRSWQNSIGYVPQQIFLADDTVSSNIAFGKKINEINQKDVERAAKIANLHDFVVNELPLKYQTFVGEKGVRLSGGQRQRIGIARALYHKPELLVFDEATSALDNLTEKKVMEAIYETKNEITKILIAHRLNTVKKCDKIFLFEKGNLVKEGTFEELFETSEKFREIADD